MVPMHRMSARNRLQLRLFELRSTTHFAAARVRRMDWAAIGRATLASFAVVGGCHSAVHTAEYRAGLTAPRGPSLTPIRDV